MPLPSNLQTAFDAQQRAISQTAAMLKANPDGMTFAQFDSMDATEQLKGVPDCLHEMFDSIKDPEGRALVLSGVNSGIAEYRARNGGEDPTAQMVAFGIAAGASLFAKNEQGKNSFDMMGFDDIHAQNHDAVSVIPAMTVVTIATAIASSLQIIAMLPNAIGSNEVPLVYGRMTANRKHGGLNKGDYLDGEKSSFGYFENRQRFAMTVSSGTTYQVTPRVAYLNYAAKTPDTSTIAAPFLGGRVRIFVNGVEVANDRNRSNSKQSGTTSLTAIQDIVIASTAVLVSAGTANLDTHLISVTFAAALPVGAVVTADVVFDYERLDGSELPILRPPGVDIETEHAVVLASPSRFQIKASLDAITQMSNELNLGFMGQALSLAQNKFYLEQTIRLLNEGKERAEQNGRTETFDASRGVTGNLAAAYNTSGDLIGEVRKTLAFAGLKISQTVGQSVNSFDLFVGNRGAIWFKTLRDDVFNASSQPLASHNQIVRIGSMKDGTNVYHVPSSTGLLSETNTSAELLMVARSAEAAKSQFVGHMPVPPMIRSANPSEFTEQIGGYMRTAAELNPLKRYGDQVAVISMINLPQV